MKKSLTFMLLGALYVLPASAADRTIDLSAGCKTYQLRKKAWVEIDARPFNGLGLSQSQILRDQAFTVFRTKLGIFGMNRRCVLKSSKSAPAPAREGTRSPWAAVFSLGYNLSPSGKLTTTFAGATTESDAKFSGSISFLGEANYRVNRIFRMALELGISQLALNSQEGNETSFFDTRPEFVFRRPGSKWEYYVGPMVGVFFLSQNTQTSDLSTGETIKVNQQTATATLFGVGGGADYALNGQFDLGFYLRYFKPGTLRVTGAETSPVAGASYSSELTTSYLNAGVRFVVHF